MKRFLDIVAHVPHGRVHGSNPTITNITVDSRRTGPGMLFVARRGSTSDGHAFIADALARGCSAFLCERLPDDVHITSDISYAVVDDAHRALAEASHALYYFPARDLRMIGVTGTNGKTSCTTIIKQLLEAHGERVGMIGTVGNIIGTETIPSSFTTPEAPELCELLARMRAAGCTSVVMEVSSHSLALERVHGIAFAAGVFTNLTQDHLDFHGTMDAYAQAKKKLFDGLSAEAVAIVWSDDPYAQLMLADCHAHAHAVGTREPAWVPAGASLRYHDVRNVTAGSDGVRYVVDGTMIHAPLFGAFHVANTALAWQCMASLGYDTERTASALASVHGPPGRMEVIDLGDRTGIVDYAHTPDALEKTLRSIRDVLRSGQRLHCVVGCGGDRDRTKRPVMGA
ncbi:MAG: UDP-N-acetylmuramoyl-L-alanyl-D-glutamate--2,6-diaminopimelate ligase, partial [Candidatus Kapaibacterium sp.]